MSKTKNTKTPNKTGRIKLPETIFLNNLSKQQSLKYRLAQGFGILFAVSLVLQAWAFSNVFSDIALQQSFSLSFLFIALFAFCLRAIANYSRERLCTSASRDIRYSLRSTLVSTLTLMGPSRLKIDEDAALSTRVYEQIDALDDFFSRYKPQVFMVSLIPCVILISVISVSWIAFFIFIMTAPLVVIFMVFVGHKAAEANRKQFSVLATLSNQFMDLSQGLSELKRLNKTSHARSRLSDSSEEYQRTTMGVLYLAFLSTATLELFASLSIAIMALYLGLGLLEILPWQIGSSPVTLTQGLFLLLLAPEFYLPLRQLGNDYHAKQKAEAAATDLLEIFNSGSHPHSSQVDTRKATPPHTDLVEQEPNNNNTLLSFRKLSWFESGRHRLAPISADISIGERIWLSGESGVGKSSLLHLLLGFEEAYQGNFFIKGKPFSELDVPCWRKNLAWLPQTPEWVSGSIRRNLLLGIAPPTEAELKEALNKSQSNPFIQALPNGIETSLTELGSGLSGGQMQRLSIARALLSHSDVWLLDEPCSGLDKETADAVLDTLNQVSKGKTLLIVSHDTHPILWADKHWVLTKEGLHES